MPSVAAAVAVAVGRGDVEQEIGATLAITAPQNVEDRHSAAFLDAKAVLDQQFQQRSVPEGDVLGAGGEAHPAA